MTDKDIRNLASVRRMYEGDESERAAVAQNIVWHVPGHNPVSGEYRGFDEYMNLMPQRMAPLTRWDFTLDDVMVNGDYVTAIFRVQGERNGKRINVRGSHLMRLDDDGRIAEGWGFTSDQDAVDHFFSN
jgi:ketosteroid isomerase-like protein